MQAIFTYTGDLYEDNYEVETKLRVRQLLQNKANILQLHTCMSFSSGMHGGSNSGPVKVTIVLEDK